MSRYLAAKFQNVYLLEQQVQKLYRTLYLHCVAKKIYIMISDFSYVKEAFPSHLSTRCTLNLLKKNRPLKFSVEGLFALPFSRHGCHGNLICIANRTPEKQALASVQVQTGKASQD